MTEALLFLLILAVASGLLILLAWALTLWLDGPD